MEIYAKNNVRGKKAMIRIDIHYLRFEQPRWLTLKWKQLSINVMISRLITKRIGIVMCNFCNHKRKKLNKKKYSFSPKEE